MERALRLTVKTLFIFLGEYIIKLLLWTSALGTTRTEARDVTLAGRLALAFVPSSYLANRSVKA